MRHRTISARTAQRRRSAAWQLAAAFAALCALAATAAPAANHLRGSKSAYLERASDQPVDWYPWGAEAWKRARELNRPVLLDMGAVWCGWCTLMDRESYTSAETAAYINSHFVAVKLDYDAAPALAAQLERAQAVLNLPAGLPLTGFVTPKGVLYFGGGYFPAKASKDKPAFNDVLQQAEKMYRQQSAQIEREGVQLKTGE